MTMIVDANMGRQQYFVNPWSSIYIYDPTQTSSSSCCLQLTISCISQLALNPIMARQSVLVCVIIVAAAAIVMIPTCTTAQLYPDVYKQSCPLALPIIRSVVEKAIFREARIGASLLRLHFHDCFVNVSFRLMYVHELLFSISLWKKIVGLIKT